MIKKPIYSRRKKQDTSIGKINDPTDGLNKKLYKRSIGQITTSTRSGKERRKPYSPEKPRNKRIEQRRKKMKIEHYRPKANRDEMYISENIFKKMNEPKPTVVREIPYTTILGKKSEARSKVVITDRRNKKSRFPTSKGRRKNSRNQNK